MNEELQKALLSILNSTVNAATAAKEFLIAETPEVVRQLLIWKAIESAIFFFAFVGLLVAAVFLARALYGKARAFKPKNIWDDCNGTWLGFGFTVVLSLFFIFGILANLTWLQILIAPKIYLVQFAASLVK